VTTREPQSINLGEHESQARVSFIPDLKAGVFVTLCTHDVTKKKTSQEARLPRVTMAVV
jgi:hypothetical protein